jgi:hypothetical protein
MEELSGPLKTWIKVKNSESAGCDKGSRRNVLRKGRALGGGPALTAATQGSPGGRRSHLINRSTFPENLRRPQSKPCREPVGVAA